MQSKDCFFLGKVAKKFSFKGELLLFIDADNLTDYLNLESVFVEFDSQELVPFFIERAQVHNMQYIRVKFEEVDNEQEANRLVGKSLFLPLNMLPKLEGDAFYYHEIEGFAVLDVQYGNLGVLTKVNDTNRQLLLEIEHLGQTILVPMVDDFIEKIDWDTRTLHLKTPAGLIELYL